MNPAGLLAALKSILRQIQSLTPADKAAWHADAERRLAIERLWIMTGNAAEAYRKAVDIPPGVEPWAELDGFRSAELCRGLHNRRYADLRIMPTSRSGALVSLAF